MSMKFILLVSILFICCDNTNDSVDEITFNINYELLNKMPFKDGFGFSINLPLGYSKLDSSNFFKLKEINKESIISLELLQSYQSINNLIFCNIYKVNSNFKNFAYIPAEYNNLLKEQFSVPKINIADFNFNKNFIRQYIIANDQMTLIKLFISGYKEYQIDYFIPTNLYAKEILSIESSIGSITSKERIK